MSIFENSFTRRYDATKPFQQDRHKVSVLSESVFVNSNDGRSTGIGAYTVPLPQEYRNITSMRLLSAEIPSSFYNFSSVLDNTTLALSSGNVTLADGVYTAQSLVDTVQSSSSLTAAYDTTTGKCTLTSASTITLDETSLSKALGFQGQTELLAGQPTVSPLCVNVDTLPYLLLSIRNFNQSMSTISPSTPGIPEVFGKVWICSKTAWQYNYYDKKFSETTLSPPTTANRLEIQWLSPDLKPVDFNGFPVYFTIEMFCTTSERSV